MKNIINLKKKILYRSEHRGTKEMDLLLSNFVKKYIDSLTENELNDLESLLNFDDETLYKWFLDHNLDTYHLIEIQLLLNLFFARFLLLLQLH